MNYLISTYANRVNGKNCYTIESKGKVIKSKVFRFTGDNIKENALECICKALLEIQNLVSHDDILIIEVQNVHLTEWLDGMKEYKGYETGLDKVFDVLEYIDCRYRFKLNKNPYAKLIGTNDITKEQYTSSSDLFKELEG